MHISELETPAACIALDTLHTNITQMQLHCDTLGIGLRAHTNAHNIPQIARMQVDAGAVGIACNTVNAAETFAEAGLNNIMIPNNVVGEAKTRRLVDLATYNRVTVSADHISVIAGMADAAKEMDINVRVLIEVATRMQRTGAKPHEVVTLAQRIEEEEQLHFAGIMIYPRDVVDRPLLQEALDSLNRAGLGVDVVSGGGFGTALKAAQLPELTEMRVGTYALGDWRAVKRGWTLRKQCALTVATTVISRPDPDRVLLDAGSRALSLDSEGGQHGLIMEYPDARIYTLSNNHAHADFSACDDRPVIGERLHILPVNASLVTYLFDTVYGVRGEAVEATWLPVLGM